MWLACFPGTSVIGWAYLAVPNLKLGAQAARLPQLYSTADEGRRAACAPSYWSITNLTTAKSITTFFHNLSSHKAFRSTAVAAMVTAIVLASFSSLKTRSQTAVPDYKNAGLSVDERVADLLKRMTVEEKVAQLTCLWAQRPQVVPQTDFSTDR